MKSLRSPKAPWLLTIGTSLMLLILAALYHHAQSFSYTLSPAAANLVGTSAEHPLKSLQYDAKAHAHTLEGTAPEANSVHAGVNSYSAVLPDVASKGISITDPTTKISLGFAPTFRVGNGKLDHGRLLYPLPNYRNATLVYTLKNNGVEENLVLNKKGSSDSTSFSYKLNLSDGTEARMLPDGSVGVYGGDPTLYGNINYSTSADRLAVEKARKHAKKTTLLYGIPAPVIKGGNHMASANFKLTGSLLTVQVENLMKATYPLSIDPSLVLVSGTDWGQGTGENIDFSNPAQVGRSGLTGGTTGAWTSTTAFTGTSNRFFTQMEAYNGYLYVIGGMDNVAFTALAKVQYASINSSTGAIGAWTSGPDLPEARQRNGTTIYNGYLYVVGGCNSTSNPCAAATVKSTVFYSKINSDGSLGSWQTAAHPISAVEYDLGLVAYDGFLYRLGGIDGSNTNSTVAEYARLNGDGSVGAWVSSTAIPSGRSSMGTAVYNGVIYLTGGWNGTTFLTTISQIDIDSDGSLAAAWTTSGVTLHTGLAHHKTIAANGYLYSLGGYSTENAVDVMPIYADGTLGPREASTAFSNGRHSSGVAYYKGYLYMGGGISDPASCSPSCAYYNDVQYAKVDAEGTTTAYATTNAMPSSAMLSASAAGDGVLYDTGGCTTADASSSTCTTTSAVVRYGVIGSTGAVTWSTTTSLPAGRWAHQAVVYNGYLYVLGGCTNLGLPGCTATGTVLYAPIASNGTIGTWTTQTGKIANVTQFFGAVGYNGFLYVLGGNIAGGGGATNTTQYFPVAANGSLGTSVSGRALPTAMFISPIAMYGNRLYYGNGSTIISSVIQSDGSLGVWTTAGSLSGQPVSDTTGTAMLIDRGYIYLSGDNATQAAPINNDGTIGSWMTLGTIHFARKLHTFASYNGNMYIFAGCTNTTSYTNVSCSSSSTENYVATANNGGPGALGAYTTNSAANLVGRQFAQSIVSNGYLYVAGGTTSLNGAANRSDIQYSLIGPDGSLGAWQTTTTALPSALEHFGMVAYGNNLYIVGGENGSNVHLANTWQVAIDSSGDITNSWTAGPNLNVARSWLTVVENNGILYASGGANASGTLLHTTEYIKLLPSGAYNGAWTTATNNFSQDRLGFYSMAANSYLYVIAGQNSGDCSVPLSSIEYAPINADGSLGSWQTTTNAPRPMSQFSAVVANGFVYVSGGCGGAGGNYTSNTWFAPILSGGGIGNWSLTTVIPSTGAQDSQASAYYNGSYYIVSGKTAATIKSTVTYANVQSISHLGRYTKLFATDKDTTSTNLIIRFSGGDSLFPASYTTASLASPTLGTATSINFLNDTKANIVNPQAAYYQFNLTLNDSANATFPDTASSPTTLNYFQLNYHPNSSMRLRGGKTFNNGSQQSLDTP